MSPRRDFKRPPDPLKTRPTETLTGIGLATAVYGFLAEAGVQNTWAAVIAVAIAFVPALISNIVDRLDERRRLR